MNLFCFGYSSIRPLRNLWHLRDETWYFIGTDSSCNFLFRFYQKAIRQKNYSALEFHLFGTAYKYCSQWNFISTIPISKVCVWPTEYCIITFSICLVAFVSCLWFYFHTCYTKNSDCRGYCHLLHLFKQRSLLRQ